MVEVRRLPSGRSTWHTAADLPAMATDLLRDNATEDIYVGANPRARPGGTRNTDVPLARCLLVDFDHTTIDQVRPALASAGLPEPTLILASGHGIHCYWRLAEPMTDLDAWRGAQRALIGLVRSDPKITDPARIMRLPGFTNHKAPVARSCVVDSDPTRRYALADLVGTVRASLPMTRDHTRTRTHAHKQHRTAAPARETVTVQELLGLARDLRDFADGRQTWSFCL
jgi:hypothetical protein